MFCIQEFVCWFSKSEFLKTMFVLAKTSRNRCLVMEVYTNVIINIIMVGK